VPAVEVDGDNNVSLRGNPNVVVQINGRVSPMRGQQLGTFLAQLPANIVAKVEVVSNPSAKNDPDGLGGIVNIILKQQADLGTSGGLTAGGGSTGQVNANGNLGHQSGPWTLFGSYGFMHDRRTVSGFSSRNDFGTAAAGAALAADVAGVMRPESHSVTATAEYRAGARDVLANNLVFNRRAMTRDFGSFYRALSSAGALTGRSDQRTRSGLVACPHWQPGAHAVADGTCWKNRWYCPSWNVSPRGSLTHPPAAVRCSCGRPASPTLSRRA